MADFPDVPDAAGVPAVGRLIGAELPPEFTELADAIGLGNLLTPQWGIFDDTGYPAFTADTVVSVDFERSWSICTYPIEDGGFQSYNKVAQPYQGKITFALTGGDLITAAISALSGGLFGKTSKPDFLGSIYDAASGFDLYSLVTPDETYDNASIVHYDYSRSQRKGADLLTIDVWVQEVRLDASDTLSSTAQADGSDAANTGSVQGNVQPFDDPSIV